MLFVISPMNNISVQETPGRKVLYCVTQAKHGLQYLKHLRSSLLTDLLTDQTMIVKIMYILVPKKTPGEMFPTDLQLMKAELLFCFRQAKQRLSCLNLFIFFIVK